MITKRIRPILVRTTQVARRMAANVLSPTLRSRANHAYWAACRGVHHGRPGFVIGNGPSLRVQDLDQLSAEITIASNKIFLAFDHTSWRPSYFTLSDQLVAQKVASELGHHFSTVHAPADIGTHFPDCATRVWKALAAPKRAPRGRPLFSGDVSHGLHGGYSVTYQNLQLAVHLGLNPIYLVGCDHTYKGERDPRYVGTVNASDEVNHFVPGYREKGEVVNAAPVDRMTMALMHARAYADRYGISILNATRGGALEVFRRVDLNQLLKQGM